jgi:hypothetical protein
MGTTLLGLVLVFVGCAKSSSPESTAQKTSKEDVVRPSVKTPDVQKPPRATNKSAATLDYKFIEQLTVPGYTPDEKPKITETSVEKRLIAHVALKSGWTVAVDVQVGNCTEGDFRCWSPGAWQNKQNPVSLTLPEVHRSNRRLVVMTNPVNFGNTQAVGVYILSFVEHTGKTKMTQKSQWHSFGLYVTNGSHYLTVTSQKLRGIAGDLEELREKLPRSVLTNETRRVFSVYRHLMKPAP